MRVAMECALLKDGGMMVRVLLLLVVVVVGRVVSEGIRSVRLVVVVLLVLGLGWCGWFIFGFNFLFFFQFRASRVRDDEGEECGYFCNVGLHPFFLFFF
jgi:hypothetical protein